MSPLHHAAVTAVLNAPRDWDHTRSECVGLPITHEEVDGMPCMSSVWVPSEEERLAIAMGAPVVLRVMGVTHPPVSVEVL